MAEAIPYWKPGQQPTCHAGGAITGKRLVKISGTPQEGNPQVVQATAAAKAFGVAAFDAASGAKVTVIKDGIVPITAGGSITAGAEVESDASGQVVTLASGKAVGQILNTVTSGQDAMVDLY